MVNDAKLCVYERGICQNLHFDHRWYIFPSLTCGVLGNKIVIVLKGSCEKKNSKEGAIEATQIEKFEIEYLKKKLAKRTKKHFTLHCLYEGEWQAAEKEATIRRGKIHHQ